MLTPALNLLSGIDALVVEGAPTGITGAAFSRSFSFGHADFDQIQLQCVPSTNLLTDLTAVAFDLEALDINGNWGKVASYVMTGTPVKLITIVAGGVYRINLTTCTLANGATLIITALKG